MAVYRRGSTWYIRVQSDGHDIRRAVGPSKRLAAKALAAVKGEIVQGRFKLAQVKRSPRFEEAAQDYLQWAETNTRSVRSVRVHLKPLQAYFRGKALREITPWLVEKFKRERLQAKVHDRPIRPTTVNRELSCLRRCFNLALQSGKAEANAVRGVKFFREDGRRERILSPDEVQGLLAACTTHSRPFVLLALNTGMRRGEILGLTWEQVDLARGAITLTRTKSGKVRKVPLNGVVRETLQGLPRSGPFVFGGERPYGSIKTAFLAACRRAKLNGVRFHDLRHTWASYLVESGVDLRTVQELGGWSSLELVERYTHPTSEAQRRAVRVLEALARPTRWHKTGTVTPAGVVLGGGSMRS